MFEERSTRLVVLDPRRFSFLNGVDKESRAALRAALGIGDEKLAVQWASSAVFAVANTQRRKIARQHAADCVAWKRVCDLEAVCSADDLAVSAQTERDAARKTLEEAVRKAFQHIVYLDVGEGGQGRAEREVRFEQDNQTSLDGSLVWKKLEEEGKAFPINGFDARALLHNLTDDDYGRPLDELRDLFWSAPRFALLPGGEGDLQKAIYEAISQGEIRLVGDDGVERAVARPVDIGIGSASLRIARSKPKTGIAATGGSYSTAGVGSSSGVAQEPAADEPAGSTGAGKDTSDPPTDGEMEEVQVSFAIRSSLADPERRDQVWNLVKRLATDVDGEASHIEAVVKVVLPRKAMNDLVDRAKDAGATPSITEI